MEKAVMVGVFDFVSFHVCKALLDKGIEVRGVQIESEENQDFLLEEKRLEIGRNANFSVTRMDDLTIPNQKETIVLSVYDLYMLYKEDILLNDEIKNLDNWDRMVVLAPSQLVTNATVSEAEAIMGKFINGIKELNKNIQILYLPTIFGPWQTDTFIFQHSILNVMNRGKEFRELREDTNDALFIEDTVESIIEIIEKEEPGGYLFQSGKKNQWDLCADFLGISEHIVKNRKVDLIDDKITKVTVKNTVPLSIALTKQIDLAHRINI